MDRGEGGRVGNLLGVNGSGCSTGRERSQRQRGIEAVALKIKYKPRWAKLVEKWQIRTVSRCPGLTCCQNLTLSPG